MVEHDLTAMASEKFSPTCLRNATAFGYSPRIRFDLVLNNLVAWAFTTGKVFLKSDGSAWRPIVHVQDISRAFVAALERRAISSTTMPSTWRKRPELSHPPDRRDRGPDRSLLPRRVRTRRFRRRPLLPRRLQQDSPHAGHVQAHLDRRNGSSGVLEAYTRFGLTLQEFEGPKYQRLAHIKLLLNEGTISADLRFAEPAGAGAERTGSRKREFA